MKTAAVIRGGVIGGLLAVMFVVFAGQILGVSIAPWNWTSGATGYPGRAAEWARAAMLLAPVGVVLGIVAAFACALVFERVTRRAGWLSGAIVGLVLGTIAASIVGLVPWGASWFSYAYMPATPPLGSYDVSWFFAVIVIAGLVTGAVAGACYGTPRHASDAPPPIRWREVYSAPRESR
jgi:hypothetical protein